MADDPIATAVVRIEQHELQAATHAAEAARWKIFVNGADELAGRDPRYPDVNVSTVTSTAASAQSRVVKWSAGEFLGSPFATAAKTVLQARFDAAAKPSPASVDDIRESLVQGTFDFGTSNLEAQRQSIRISLGKNSGVFVKLPNTDLFGLVEWYPGLKKPKGRIRSIDERETPEPENKLPVSDSEDFSPTPTANRLPIAE